MPEPYATKTGADGKTIYYKTRKDYDKGVWSSHLNTKKRLKKSNAI